MRVSGLGSWLRSILAWGRRSVRRPAAHALPEQIAYDADHSVTTTCDHLSAVEGALRSVGMRLHLRRVRHVEVAGPLDLGHWRAHFAIPDCVVAEEVPAFDRSHLDPPVARLRCAACDSSIVGSSVASGKPR